MIRFSSMSAALWLLLTITLYPVTVNCQPQPTVLATAYCLKGHTTSGPRTSEVKGRCIALTTALANHLGLKKGPGRWNYRFGTQIEVTGHGVFTFADIMPPKRRPFMVDIWHPTKRQCEAFGVKRCQVRVVK